MAHAAAIAWIVAQLGAGFRVHGHVREDGATELRSPNQRGLVLVPRFSEVRVQMLVVERAPYQDVFGAKEPAAVLEFIRLKMAATGGFFQVKDASSPPWYDYAAEAAAFPDEGGDGMDMDDI